MDPEILGGVVGGGMYYCKDKTDPNQHDPCGGYTWHSLVVVKNKIERICQRCIFKQNNPWDVEGLARFLFIAKEQPAKVDSKVLRLELVPDNRESAA